MTRRVTVSLSLVVAAPLTGLFLTGCTAVAPAHPPIPHPQAHSTARASTPAPPVEPPAIGTSATAVSAQLAVYGSPDGAVTETLANPQSSGAPLTFLVASAHGDWLQVDLACFSAT
jgi:hypothetical protein